MAEAPETRESLILRLHDAEDREAWEQFTEIYRPVVYRLARLNGLQDADAQDLSQRVLLSVSQSISDWEPRPGVRFRHWLSRVAKNAVVNLLTRKPRDLAQGGSDLLPVLAEQAAGESGIGQTYEQEYQRQLYRRAADVVRSRADETTWLAFSLTMIDGHSVEYASQQLGLSVGSIYAARSRIVRRLRVEVDRFRGQVERGGDDAKH